MRKFKYIGNSSLEPASRHFVIEVEEDDFQKAKNSKSPLRGRVIEANKKSPWPVGYYSITWVNPFRAMEDYGFPCLILID